MQKGNIQESNEKSFFLIKKGLQYLLSFAFFLLIILFGVLLYLNLYFENRVLPKTKVAGIDVSGLPQKEAYNLIKTRFTPYQKLYLVTEDKKFDLELSELEFSYNFESTLKSILTNNRSPNLITNSLNIVESFFNEKNFPLVFTMNEKKLEEYLQVVSDSTQIKPIYPGVSYEEGEILVERGSPGRKLNKNQTKTNIYEALSRFKSPSIDLEFEIINSQISEEEAVFLENKAKKLIGKSITLLSQDKNFTLEDKKLLSLIDVKKDYSLQKILQYITKEVSPNINQDPQNAVFKFVVSNSGGGRVVEFKPHKEGLKVNEELLSNEILKTLNALEVSSEKSLSIQIPVEVTLPQITSEKVNNLGINELLGRGVSRFTGSIPSRVHNISLAASRLNGILVPPGETFSFNENLGDVSVYTGYKQAYIIKDGRTVLGDGGGVCQVSTTLFRAVLDAGLPIIERRAHSYRVYYYEQDSPPGLDATVYAPTTDFKFKNDTPQHILIQTQVDTKTSTLTFEIYGTKDGRKVTVSKPIIQSSTPPPPDLYIDDPNLPAGTIKQIDYKAWGAKVSFDYKVEKEGKIIFEKTFVSNYRPWQAVFLRGTGSI